MSLSLFAEPLAPPRPKPAPAGRRALQAARILLAYSSGGEPPGRAYDALFEAGDGAQVAAHLEALATLPTEAGGMAGLREALRGSLACRYVSPELVAKVCGNPPLFPEVTP